MTTRQSLCACFCITLLLLQGATPTVAGPPPGKGKSKTSLSITLASSIIQETEATTGTVTLNNPAAGSAVSVDLLASALHIVTIQPASVSLSEANPSQTFTVSGQPGDGDRSVTITATDDGELSDSIGLTVTDEKTYPYLIMYAELPPDAVSGGNINAVNNLGQVVGWYLLDDGGTRAFIYDPFSPNGNPLFAVPLDDYVTSGPDLWSAVAINDNQVIVGTRNASGNRGGFLLDYGAQTGTIEHLPSMGSDNNYGMRINNNGDILGVFKNVDEQWRGYFCHQSAVGDANALPLTGRIDFCEMNNPQDGFPTQICGTDSNGVPYRYTTGLDIYEEFPELVVSWDRLRGINDSGTFCGTAKFSDSAKGKNKNTALPFRYNTSVDILPPRVDPYWSPGDLNNSGDLFCGRHIYRDEWQAWRYIGDLVDGSLDDLADWHSENPSIDVMSSERVSLDDAGFLAGWIGSTDTRRRLFLLVPNVTP